MHVKKARPGPQSSKPTSPSTGSCAIPESESDHGSDDKGSPDPVWCGPCLPINPESYDPGKPSDTVRVQVQNAADDTIAELCIMKCQKLPSQTQIYC